MPTIEIVVDSKGNTTIEGKDFPDGTCLKETKSIEEALGKVTKRTKKVEADRISSGAGKVTVGSKK